MLFFSSLTLTISVFIIECLPECSRVAVFAGSVCPLRLAGCLRVVFGMQA
jgi:hypothetical protein